MFAIIETCLNILRRIRRVSGGTEVFKAPDNVARIPETVIIYQKPPGGAWFPMWDFALNACFEARGIGWRDYEAIAIWRDSAPMPGVIFTSILMENPALNAAGLWWRPLPHALRPKRTLH